MSRTGDEGPATPKLLPSWKGTTAADDINPEMYLYTVLQDYVLYDDMKAVVQTRQPNSPEVKELAAWVKSRQN